MGGLCLAATVLVADLSVVVARHGEPRGTGVEAAAVAAFAALGDLSAPPETTTTTAPPPPPEPTTTTTAPPPPARPGPWTVGPYQGVGVWLDVYDWTNALTNGHPKVQAADVDRMADLGIQTLYIQTAHRRSDADVIEPERLQPFLDRAHARGMAVVAWYLPTFEDLDADFRRLVAASNLEVDGLGVDIESLAIKDPVERTRRLMVLSQALDDALGARTIAAITQSPVVMQVVNPSFWPGFPWPELAQAYDVIIPMSYWSVRKADLKNGERVSLEDIDRIRASTGQADIPISVAGGIADGITLDDVAGMIRAVQSRGALGASLYDWNTSQPAQWDLLRALRAG